MAVFFHKWRIRLLQGALVFLVFVVYFILMEQTKSEVILINRTPRPITVEEVFVGNKIENEKMEPFGFEYIHTKDSDVLRDQVLGPNEQIIRRFRVRKWKLFRVAYFSPEGKSVWYETGAVRYWGNRISVEFTESNGAVLKSEASLLRSWLERNRNSILGSSWLE